VVPNRKRGYVTPFMTGFSIFKINLLGTEHTTCHCIYLSLITVLSEE
jgi:hypothetical protein